MIKTKYKATIYDGHSHIERVVWQDATGNRYVRINGFYFLISELKNYEVSVWYDG